ncbi:MAG: hypothetical protein GKR90_21840 [Pseudomonadales bacterium]|nr:hypothetical protein [Pseudomonadales bacterium]
MNPGKLYIRRACFIEATPAQVWREFADFAHIHAWLGLGHTLHAFDPQLGGITDFSVDIGGVDEHFGGPVTEVVAGELITFEVTWANPEMATPAPMYWSYVVTSALLTSALQGTSVEFYQYGFDAFGTVSGDELLSYENAWQPNHLTALRDIVLAR